MTASRKRQISLPQKIFMFVVVGDKGLEINWKISKI